MRRHIVAPLFICIVITGRLFARIPAPPGFEGVRSLAEKSPMVFRGEVGDLTLTKNEPNVREGVAVISVDRWYRGSQLANAVKLHFMYRAAGIRGHDCIDLTVGSYWIVFAKPGHGETFELADDCVGALAVSSMLGPDVSTGFLSQMEADFAAGLEDSDSAARIASIQRLAGLGKISSAEALHHVIASGTEDESRWAIFAALKTGDTSVLPLAVPILINLQHEEAKQVREPSGFVYTQTSPYPEPEGVMALAISKLRAPDAIPSLTKLVNESSDDLVRMCAREALLEINKASGVRKSD